MDPEQLKIKLSDFISACRLQGKPIDNLCIVEAYPGVTNTSYTLQVKEVWSQNILCSDAIEILYDILWETTTPEIRQNIFAIQIMDSEQELQCEGYTSNVRK